MRLFGRRKEVELDDPRLVGMNPLKPTEESANDKAMFQKPGSKDESPTVEDVNVLTQNGQPDKCKLTNGISAWKRVSKPWDSLRRCDSTEHVSRSVMSNRRKTLHFCPEEERPWDKYREEAGTGIPNRLASEPGNGNAGNERVSATLTPKRKIGRVESLRLLLSKSNKIYRGKIVNPKQDKGTDTQDLNNDVENFHQEMDEAFRSKYSSISSVNSTALLYPLSATAPFRNQFQMLKTASCENLSMNLYNRNQGKTLPGYRDMSTSTTTCPDSSCFSPQPNNVPNNGAKRSSFPYAYIRSRLSSLQEEPKKTPAKPPRTSIIHNQQQVLNKPACSLNSAFMHKGFYHSMGNLLTETKEEGHSSPVDCDTEDDGDVDNGSGRIFDPLKQIRIDLLHRNPSEIDEQSSPSPTFWGRRSYSIGDMLEKRKVGKSVSAASTGIEESGYDSDSTRNGHESPRNSVKSPSSEGEGETILDSEQFPIKENANLPISEEDSTKSGSKASISMQPNKVDNLSSSVQSLPVSDGSFVSPGGKNNARSPSVNGFRKGEDGSIIEVTSEIDQAENVDMYSAAAEGTLEAANFVMRDSVLRQKQISFCNPISSKVTLSCNGRGSEGNDNRSGETSVIVVEPNKEQGALTDSIKKETNEGQKTAPSLRLRNRVRDRNREWNSIKPSRSKSLCLSIFTVTFHKAPKKKGLGFSVIGGKGSPVPGIFIKRIFPYGQASEHGGLTEGDEILSINGQPLANFTHSEAVNIFKSIKTGDVTLEVARREFQASSTNHALKRQYSQLSSKSCEQLYQGY